MINYCHDCGCKEGELHEVGCDMERCTKCGNRQQLLSCLKHSWENLKDEEREPYFFSGSSCVRCGKFFPDMLMVKKDQWEYICGSTYKKEDILCPKCMGFIRQKRDNLFKGGIPNGNLL